LHVGLSRYSPPGDPGMRLRDQLATLEHFRLAAIEHKVDLGVIAGDLFHQRNPTPAALAGVAAFAREWSTYGIPLVIVPGNHDGMTVVGDPSSHTLGWLNAVQMPGIHVLTFPQTLLLTEADGVRAGVVAYPYPHKRAFDQVRPDLTPEERMVEIGRFVQGQIADDARGFNEVPVRERIFVGHLSVAGSAIGSERVMRFGWDVAVGAEAFEGYDYAALGHIHVQQPVGTKAWYAGSPEYIDFGEAGQPKGFLLAEVERGKPPKVERIGSHPRPMVLLDHPDGDTADVAEGAIVRVLLGPGQRIDVNGAGYTEYRFDQPERPVTEGARAIDADLDWEAALRHWLTLNGHEPEPALSAAKDLIAGA
jgi:exonuclease SbcD